MISRAFFFEGRGEDGQKSLSPHSDFTFPPPWGVISAVVSRGGGGEKGRGAAVAGGPH